MTRLFNRFVEDMQLRNFSESTIRSYTYALKQLAAYFNKAPELINEQEIKQKRKTLVPSGFLCFH